MSKMAENSYKYHIQNLYESLPRGLNIIEILEKNGIPSRTFYRDRTIEKNDLTDIPGDRLFKYSILFGVSIEELFNYKVKLHGVKEAPVKYDLNNPSPTMQKVIQRTGLRK